MRHVGQASELTILRRSGIATDTVYRCQLRHFSRLCFLQLLFPEIVDACYILLDPVPGSRTDDPVTLIQPRIVLESENQCHSLLNGESEAHADVY